MSNRWRLTLGLLMFVGGLAQMGYLLARYNDPPPVPRDRQARAFDEGVIIGSILGCVLGLGGGAFLIYGSYQSSESGGGRSRGTAESDRRPRTGRSWSRENRKPWHSGRADEDDE